MVRTLRAKQNAGPVAKPEPTFLHLFLWDFQPFASLYPLHPLVVHMPSGVVQQSGDHPIAVAPVGARQLDDVFRQPFLVRSAAGSLALR